MPVDHLVEGQLMVMRKDVVTEAILHQVELAKRAGNQAWLREAAKCTTIYFDEGFINAYICPIKSHKRAPRAATSSEPCKDIRLLDTSDLPYIKGNEGAQASEYSS